MDEPALREFARITARLSATLFVATLFAFAARRRVSPRAAVRLFAAFLAVHVVHFSIVLLLAYVTGGANFRSRGGYPDLTFDIDHSVGVEFLPLRVIGDVFACVF